MFSFLHHTESKEKCYLAATWNSELIKDSRESRNQGMPASFQQKKNGKNLEAKDELPDSEKPPERNWYKRDTQILDAQLLSGNFSFPIYGHSGSAGEKEANHLSHHFNHLWPCVYDKCCLLCPFWYKLALLKIITSADARQANGLIEWPHS